MNINQYIDHTLLKPTADKLQIKKLCEEAKLYNFASVCVNPYYVAYAKECLIESDVNVCTVIGFPLGSTTRESKIAELKKAIDDGTDEFDVVMNISAFKSKQYDYVLQELKTLRGIAPTKIMKVIIENCYLSFAEIKKACEIVVKSGADYVKTSTGFGTYGAREEDLKIMIDTVKNQIKIKAAGGVSDYNTAKKYIQMGIKRIGTSKGVLLSTGKEAEKNEDY